MNFRRARKCLEEMRDSDTVPPSPDREARIDETRQRLDLAFLMGFGSTKGEASATVGSVYQSYARWRRAVEDVEMAMRGNRRAMAKSGQSRSVKPTELAARRVWEEVEHSVALFPRLLNNEQCVVEEVPSGLAMPTQEPLLDPGIAKGNRGDQIDYEHYDRLRFAAMWSRVGRNGVLPIPRTPRVARRMVDAFVAEEARLRKESRRRARTYLSDPADLDVVCEGVVRLWLRKCKVLSLEAAEARNTELP